MLFFLDMTDVLSLDYVPKKSRCSLKCHILPLTNSKCNFLVVTCFKGSVTRKQRIEVFGDRRGGGLESCSGSRRLCLPATRGPI